MTSNLMREQPQSCRFRLLSQLLSRILMCKGVLLCKHVLTHEEPIPTPFPGEELLSRIQGYFARKNMPLDSMGDAGQAQEVFEGWVLGLRGGVWNLWCEIQGLG